MFDWVVWRIELLNEGDCDAVGRHRFTFADKVPVEPSVDEKTCLGTFDDNWRP